MELITRGDTPVANDDLPDVAGGNPFAKYWFRWIEYRCDGIDDTGDEDEVTERRESDSSHKLMIAARGSR